MNELFAWLSQSITLWRGRRWSLGVDYWLLIWAAIESVQYTGHLGWEQGLIAGPMLILAAVIHCLGHVAGARFTGSALSRITGSVLLDQREMELVAQPWPMLVVGFSGPLLSLAVGFGLMALPALGLDPGLGTVASSAMGFLVTGCLQFGFANLLACSPFDGRLGWRGLLGLGLRPRQAVPGTLILAWPSCALLAAYALMGLNPLAILFAVMCIMATVRDHRDWRTGHDFVTGFPMPLRGGVSPWGKWQVALAERREQRAAARREAEQAMLDGLLEKVSQQGLHSLTDRERATLAGISRRQREQEPDR